MAEGIGPHTAWPGAVAVGGFLVIVCTTPSTRPRTPSTSVATVWVSTPKVDVPSVLQDVRADGWEATGALATQDWLAARRAAPRCGMHLPL